MVGVLQRARFVLGNDSRPTHLAARLGVPGVAGVALFDGGGVSAEATDLASDGFRTLTATRLAELEVATVRDAVLAALAQPG